MSNKDLYREEGTYLCFHKETNTPMRWTNGELYFAGDAESAVESLPNGLFTAIRVCDAPLEFRIEYRALIDMLILNGTIEEGLH